MITSKQFLDRASLLTENEWNYLLDLLNTEFDCNENPKAESIINKFTVSMTTMAKRTARQKAELEEAKKISRRWAKVLGLGFHPDTRGKDYKPALSPSQCDAYDRDMAQLFKLSTDPYEMCAQAWEELGLA